MKPDEQKKQSLEEKSNSSELPQLLKKLEEVRKLAKNNNTKEILAVIDNVLNSYSPSNPGEIIAEFVKIRDQKIKAKKLKYFRITLILIFTFTTLTVGILQFMPVFWPLEITSKIKVDQVEFKLANKWKIYQINISQFRVSKLDTLTFQSAKIISSDAPLGRSADKFSKKVIAPSSEYWEVGFKGKEIRIENISIDSAATITLEQVLNQPGEYRWKIDNAQINCSMYTGSKFSISCINCNFEGTDHDNLNVEITTKSPLISIKDLSDILIFNFNINQISDLKEFNLIEAEYLDVFGFNLKKMVGTTLVSSILEDCEISFPQLDKHKILIKSKDFLEFNSISNFKIRKISLLENGIDIYIQGKVKGIRSGLPGYFYPRFPSLLEYFQKNYMSVLYFGTLIPVLGILLAILYRLKIFDES